MKPSGTNSLLAALVVAPALAATLCLAWPARAQVAYPTPQAVQAELSDVLSFVGDGLFAPRDHPPQVARDGNAYRISIPLPGLTAPPNAAIEAVAAPLPGGMWDVTSLTLPDSGAMSSGGVDAGRPGSLLFSIGRQAAHARVDPSLSQPSSFAGEFGNLALRSESGGQRTQQTIERYTLQGVLTGDAARHLNVQAQWSAANWGISAIDRASGTVNSLIRSAAGSFNVEGLDQAQAQRLTAAARSFSMAVQAARAQAATAPELFDPPPALSPAMRAQLRAMVDASAGLLTRLEVEDTLQGIHFEVPDRNHGDVGQLRLSLGAEAQNNRLSARLDVAVTDPAASALAADAAAYLPRHIDIKPAATGVPIPQLMRLLRDATAPEPDQTVLQSEASAILGDPAANVGIASLSFDSGPLRVTGSMRLRPQVDGQIGADIHLAATGFDALVALAQGDPNVQQILPLAFLAKGMARPQGDSLVWDISVTGGGVTVNGAPMGQPQTGRPPSRR